MRYTKNIANQIKIEKEYNEAYLQLDNFFETLYHHNYEEPININGLEFNNLTYREGQNSYALDIMETIKNKDILLIQAGVGIGKSFGYLLPIFYTYNNVKTFNKIIISTSSIALQEQLLKDISKISEMLQIEIKTDIAKGINNYACLKRIYHQIEDERTNPETKTILENLSNQIDEIQSSDKADLKDISEKVWSQIQLQSRGYCSKCIYGRICPFYKKQVNINKSNIIITNHANMVRNILDKTELVDNLDMIVFDEAHKIEENMQNIQTSELRLFNLIYQVETVTILLDYKFNFKDTKYISNGNYSSLIEDNKLRLDIENLFSSIRGTASKNFFEMKKKITGNEDYDVTAATRLAFRLTPKVQYNLQEVIKGLENLFQEIIAYEKENQTQLRIKEIQYLKNAYLIFKDMLKKEESNNIYWANFYQKNKISLSYVPKDNLTIAKGIFSEEIPVVCTSGTILDNQGSYNYFSEGIGLNKITKRTITYGDEQKSPYDYDNNSLFYYNPNISSPNDKDTYIIDLAIEINELIRMSNGRSLILFTSKETMNSVYQLLSEEEYPFEVLLHTDNNTNDVKEQFIKDTNSCLFATGAFWEGIDIKGKSLSNLIITHLPFDQVDAINQYKASKYAKTEQFKQVYFPNMLTKFRQAIGRLIRSDEDTGIICCLDSRFDNYKNAISPNIPMTNFTTDKKELYQFVEEKILTEEKNKKVKKIS